MIESLHVDTIGVRPAYKLQGGKRDFFVKMLDLRQFPHSDIRSWLSKEQSGQDLLINPHIASN